MRRIDPNLKLLRGSSDPVHVDKRIYANLANWYIIVDGFRVNLSILRNIRENEILGKQLRSILPLSSVRHKDRMSSEAVRDIS